MPRDTDTPITLPAGLVARVAEAAAAEATTPEAWIERVLTRQLDERRWEHLVEAGQRQSAALGYTEADVERLIAESRAERRAAGQQVDRLTVTADTNVYISALQFDGRPDEVLRLARQGLVRLAVSEPILAEVRRVLGDKFRRAPEQVAEADRLIRGFTELVAPTRRLAVVAADPDDDRILECAVAAGAQVIVSGDKDLLRLGKFEGIEIVTVAAFLERYFPAPPGQVRTG